jgi:dienelactone hydrolase
VALQGGAGDKIAWVTEQAVEWLHDQHPETVTQPGAMVAWSLGAQGALRLATDEGRTEALGVRAMCLYYPSIGDLQTLDNRLPLLVLTGAADDVTPAEGIQELIQARSLRAPPVELHIYPGAHHGFDVASIRSRKTVRLLPFVGPKATLKYDERAAVDAEHRLVTFLANNALQRTPANGAAERWR